MAGFLCLLLAALASVLVLHAPGTAAQAPVIVRFFDLNDTFVNCSCDFLPANNPTPATPYSTDETILCNLKIILITTLGFGHLLFSLIPWFLARTSYTKHHLGIVLEICCAGAAGVILGAGFSHLLPDSTDGFTSYFEAANPDYEHADYPFSTLVAVGMTLCLLWLDQTVIHKLGGRDHHGGADNHHAAPELKRPSESCDCSPGDCECNKVHPRVRGRAYLYFIALGIHGIFEGLALGAATDLETFTGLLIAITAHKMLDGFSLGVPIYNARFPFWVSLILLIICASMTPIGIGIGWVIADAWAGAAADLAKGIVFGLTCGCFIYISLVELLPACLASGRYTVWKLLLLTLGWGAMALIATWV